jgi:hypothetical protein
MELPTQTVDGPETVDEAITVKDLVTNPVPTVYVIVTEPTLIPVTSPVELTVATAVLLLDHVPPGVASLSRVEVPTQVYDAPVIAEMPEVAVTVTDFVTIQLPTE